MRRVFDRFDQAPIGSILLARVGDNTLHLIKSLEVGQVGTKEHAVCLSSGTIYDGDSITGACLNLGKEAELILVGPLPATDCYYSNSNKKGCLYKEKGRDFYWIWAARSDENDGQWVCVLSNDKRMQPGAMEERLEYDSKTIVASKVDLRLKH